MSSERDEPDRMRRKSETVRGEEDLSDTDGGPVESFHATTRTKSGAVPSSYGAVGGTDDELSDETHGDVDERSPDDNQGI